MSDLIDLALVSDAQRLLEKLIDRHGINWFLARDGARLMALDKSKTEMVVRTAIRARERKGSDVHEDAIDFCRRQVRRALIRKVATAMVATGC